MEKTTNSRKVVHTVSWHGQCLRSGALVHKCLQVHTDDVIRTSVAGMKELGNCFDKQGSAPPSTSTACKDCELEAIFFLPKIHKILFHIFLL